MRRSISRGSINRPSQARARSMRVSESTLCPLGQSNKAIGHESQIGPCVATHRVNNCQACCVFKKTIGVVTTRNGSAEKKDPWHADTKQDKRSGEDHSRRASARSNIRAECRNKNGAASSRRGDFSLDIPFYRTWTVLRFTRTWSSKTSSTRLCCQHFKSFSEAAGPSLRLLRFENGFCDFLLVGETELFPSCFC